MEKSNTEIHDLTARVEAFEARLSRQAENGQDAPPVRPSDERSRLPVVTAILVAAVGLIGNAIVAYLNGNNSIELAKVTMETQLIIRAVTTDNGEKNRDNLDFLVKTGLVPHFDSNLKVVLSDTAYMPEFQSVDISMIGQMDDPNAYAGDQLRRIIRNMWSGENE